MGIRHRAVAGIHRAATIALIAAAAIAGATALEVAARPALTPANPANPTAIRGCVIRFDTLNPTGTLVVPRIYEDTYHVCVGVTAVSVETNGDLRLTNTGGSATVVTVWAVPDETMAADSLTCGVSGGGTVSVVRCYRSNGVRIRFDSIDDVYGPGSNIWFGGVVWMP